MDYVKVTEAFEYVRGRCGRKPELGIILGSGLGALVDCMEEREFIQYADIPYFPKSDLVGHEDRLVFGKIGKTELVAMQGRFHCYEGFTMEELVFPVYVLKMLGIKDIIITNACGGINSGFRPGDMMLIEDYINTIGKNPLIGPNDERFGVRFPDMSEAYSKELIAYAEMKAAECDLIPKKGVYALFPGPCYETAAEIRALSAIGADAVGMSTVPETISANYLGLRVLDIACVTNMATGLATEKHTHEHVVAVANTISANLTRWVRSMIETWPEK